MNKVLFILILFSINNLYSQNQYSLDFDGVDDKLELGQITTVASDDITIEAWIKPQSIPSRYVFSLGGNSHLSFGVSDDTTFSFSVALSGNDPYSVGSEHFGELDVWHHLAGIFNNSTNMLYLYLDGFLVDSLSTPNKDLYTPNSVYSNIGSYYKPFYGSHFNGRISNVHLSQDVKYTSNFCPSFPIEGTASSVGLWLLDEGSGSTATDSKGSYNGSINGPVWVQDVPDLSPEFHDLNSSGVSSSSVTLEAKYSTCYSTTYNLAYGTSTGNYSTTTSSATLSGSSTTHTVTVDITSLTSDTKYFYVATAWNSSGTTTSSESSFWTLTSEPSTQSNVFSQIGQSNNSITFSFQPLNEISADGYLIIKSNLTPANPTDGNSYSVNDTYNNTTVVGKITDQNVDYFILNGLPFQSTSAYKLVPFNVGNDPATTNYNLSNIPTLVDNEFTDTDGDGVSDIIENEAPNSGDGNGDGIKDALQSNVTSLINNISGYYQTIVSDNSISFNDVEEVEVEKNSKYNFPFGAIKFKVNSSATTIKIIYHGISRLSNYIYRKKRFGDTWFNFSNVVFGSENINGNITAKIELTLKDGGEEDYDGFKNGFIIDPGGPAILISDNIPFWNYWIFAISLLLIIITYIKYNFSTARKKI